MGASGLGRLYEDGEVIVAEGDEGHSMFVVQFGKVAVSQVSEGEDVPLAVVEAGEIFGEMALFEHERRSATVRAVGETRVLTVDKRTFFQRVQEDPTLAFNVLRHMSARIRDISTELSRMKAQRSGGS